MKANELRLENLVESLEAVLTVDTITSGSSVDLRTAEGKIYNTPLELCKPIPLTEEWLVKFGIYTYESKEFLNKGVVYYSSDNVFYIYSGMGDEDSYGFKIEIKYVHQLQNLYFALTNEELIIK